MKDVFLLSHYHRLKSLGNWEDIKFIWVYSTKNLVYDAIEKLKTQPGFKDNYKIIDLENDDESWFYIEEYELDKLHWQEWFSILY